VALTGFMRQDIFYRQRVTTANLSGGMGNTR